MRFIDCVDTHTGGEPTRVVFSGGPDLGTGTMAERVVRFRQDFDHLRTALIHEPRGCDWIVGALLVPPREPESATGVLFFNNRGYLGMCGHGLIGVVRALAHRGSLVAGKHVFETPAGMVSATLHEDDAISIENVVSYRSAKQVPVLLPSGETVLGDIAYGGNWFFLVSSPPLDYATRDVHLARCKEIKQALQQHGITGDEGAEIDHVELCAPWPGSQDPDSPHSQNFVLCPGGEYDRSPCGTGTSAKLACLAADGHLLPGEIWRQASIVGSLFEGTYRPAENGIRPTITGRAYVTAEIRFVLGEDDPFRHGIVSQSGMPASLPADNSSRMP